MELSHLLSSSFSYLSEVKMSHLTFLYSLMFFFSFLFCAINQVNLIIKVIIDLSNDIQMFLIFFGILFKHFSSILKGVEGYKHSRFYLKNLDNHIFIPRGYGDMIIELQLISWLLIMQNHSFTRISINNTLRVIPKLQLVGVKIAYW